MIAIWIENNGIAHSGSVTGEDYTLCGFSLDGEEGNDFFVKSERGKVTCKSCIQIIDFCKTIPARKLAREAK